ncbi:tetratricopeptide repeat protein [Chamaesiphon sp. OTE_75_metabat_556]|uniref:tetratricopeptide repeat protein n=1 Tax=Chamaesiphon sp. OTE_75_metabat_556 TaxID=2964692 RepID=UPI00286CA2B1|nr:tetratricopeptide repeat protein [Chamaesiphon sp. OTE_75_metabat_556]
MLATLVFIITGFWIWMLIDCSQDKRTRSSWFWIVLLCYFPGALVYFVDRQNKPQTRKIVSPLRHIQLKQELYRARIAARHIGKAYQFLILGNILLELGDLDRAALSYQRALSKEPKNPYALWGAASVAFDRKRFAVAARHLELLLKIDPKHLQGDASILYAKVLFNLGKWSIARSHLKEDIHDWGHPESTILLARIEIQDRNTGIAKKLLEDLLSKLKDSPTYHARRHQQVSKEAASMLRSISLPSFR